MLTNLLLYAFYNMIQAFNSIFKFNSFNLHEITKVYLCFIVKQDYILLNIIKISKIYIIERSELLCA